MGLLTRLRRRCPAALKMLVRRLQAGARRRLIRVLATDERAEAHDLERRGQLKLNAADAAVLHRPLGPSELYEIDESALDSSRFLFYPLDAPLRPADVAAFGLDALPYWDRIFTNLERPFELHWLIRVLRSRAASGGACLEVGCGRRFPGPYLLATRYDRVTAIDLDPGIMENDPWKKVSFEVVDATRLPFAEAVFDDVYSISVIEHFKLGAAAEALREIHRVLKPGGRFVGTLGIGDERKSWPGRHHPDDIYGSRDVPFWVGLLRNTGFRLQVDPHGQGRYNDFLRLLRVSVDARSGRRREFATYRFVATKPGV